MANSKDPQRAFQTLERLCPDVLWVNIENRIATCRQIIADAAIRLRIPCVSGYRGFVDVGGLMSYGAGLTAIYPRGAIYNDPVFRGAKPAELPIEQPTKFELAINLRTAGAIRPTIPQAVLLRADEVIQ